MSGTELFLGHFRMIPRNTPSITVPCLGPSKDLFKTLQICVSVSKSHRHRRKFALPVHFSCLMVCGHQYESLGEAPMPSALPVRLFRVPDHHLYLGITYLKYEGWQKEQLGWDFRRSLI